MKITVASGKGGTGKTTIATSLALSLAGLGVDTWYVDCDVEAPNGYIFLKPEIISQSQAVVQIPHIQFNQCNGCGKCVSVCQFHALVQIDKIILVYPAMCHGCGSCTWNCPERAIFEVPKPIGTLEKGITGEGIQYLCGALSLGEPMPTPVIRQLKRLCVPAEEAVVVYDAPPGASCSVVESLRGADFALLVTEPTPFGLHDLQQVLGIVREMNIPMGVAINRDGFGDRNMDKFLAENRIPVLLRIPFLKQLAVEIASGNALIRALPEYDELFRQMYYEIRDAVYGGNTYHA